VSANVTWWNTSVGRAGSVELRHNNNNNNNNNYYSNNNKTKTKTASIKQQQLQQHACQISVRMLLVLKMAVFTCSLTSRL